MHTVSGKGRLLHKFFIEHGSTQVIHSLCSYNRRVLLPTEVQNAVSQGWQKQSFPFIPTLSPVTGWHKTRASLDLPHAPRLQSPIEPVDRRPSALTNDQKMQLIIVHVLIRRTFNLTIPLIIVMYMCVTKLTKWTWVRVVSTTLTKTYSTILFLYTSYKSTHLSPRQKKRIACR